MALFSRIGITLIAGPCALESRDQLRRCVDLLEPMGITAIRASLWKPRTYPGWDGLGVKGIDILLEETLPRGLVPATEVLTKEHAVALLASLQHYGKEGRLLAWIGARNQNHLLQQAIARRLAEHEGVSLMFKHQMWEEEDHWLGLAAHLLQTGFPKERLIACHRGFAPGRAENPHQWRNLPNFAMAMRIKERTGLPMLLDPSHIGGAPEKVLQICELATQFPFDGYFVEMHCDPQEAFTDAQQQLAPEQLQQLLALC